MNVIIFALIVVAVIVFSILYQYFQNENSLAEVQESTKAIVCLTLVYTVLAMTGIVLLTLSIVNNV